jgi:hypothetical protein
MKNIQIIDAAKNCVYDIFAATDEEFSLLFPPNHDIAFIDEICSRVESISLEKTFSMIWSRRLRKCDAMGIHGLIFYDLDYKKSYYPTRCDEEARNPDGTLLRNHNTSY